MVGINGHPQRFGNALDVRRTLLVSKTEARLLCQLFSTDGAQFDSGSEAERIRAEMSGNPQETCREESCLFTGCMYPSISASIFILGMACVTSQYTGWLQLSLVVFLDICLIMSPYISQPQTRFVSS